MTKPKKPSRAVHRGFSMLEMVGVIAIAGSVSATALPHLIDLPGEARVSVVKGLHGAVRTASSLTHMACAVRDDCSLNAGTSTVVASGSQVILLRGYPQGGDPAGIENALDFDGFTPVRLEHKTIFQKDGAPAAETCAVTYASPQADGDAPTITLDTAGC